MLGEHDDVLLEPFTNPERYLVHEERLPFGLGYIDEVLGGGLARGELCGLLGPTGGGKTVISSGLAVEQALRGRDVLLVTFEQPLKGDVMERMSCIMTGIPVSEFRGRAYHDLEPEVRKRLDEQRAKFGRHIKVLDLSSSIGSGAAAIVAKLEELDKKGQLPFLVIIDWLGAAVERQIAGGSGRAKSEDAYRRIATQIINEMRAAQVRLGFTTLMIHQLSTKASRASSSRKPVVTDAYEFKAFAYYMDVCLCLGTLSADTRVGYFISDKNRRSPVCEILVKLDGDMQMFRRADTAGFVLDHTGAFVPAGRAPADADEIVGKASRPWH
jgi:RecA/RadA recombinase